MPSFVLLVGRILASAIFIEAGWSKLMNISGTIGYFEGIGLPMANVAIWGVIALELIGGVLILVGFLTRITAVALAAFSCAAAAIGHSDIANLVHFQALMKDLAIAGGYLFLAVRGAGNLSFDSMRQAG